MDGLIDDEAKLERLTERLAGRTLVALDTEFVRERTYYPQLCLVQIATDELAACVDCLAPLDLAPLFTLLGGEDLTWVLHSGRQDLEVIRQHSGMLPARLIDTQIAAALAGHAAQIGLREALAAVLGVDIGKAYTRTDWSRRPLPQGALRYALDDVRHLLALLRRLEDDLAAHGRLEWLAEDSARLLEEASRSDLLPIWSRLKSVQAFDADAQAAALALIRWRERTASTLDRPRRWIMSDELLTRIAQLRPATVRELQRIAEMPKRLAQKQGEAIVAALAGRDDPELVAELARLARSERPDKETLKALQARVKKSALELGIEPEVLASRRDLSACLSGAAPGHLRAGWRAALLGPLLAGA